MFCWSEEGQRWRSRSSSPRTPTEAVRLTRLRQLNVLPEDEDDLPMESERAGLFFDAVGMGPSDEE
jgi:hypothetical protein